MTSPPDADLLPGFSSRHVATSGGSISLATAGAGPPLLLLHGYPETHLAWHRVAGQLARCFSVVAADLPGYGASACPASDHGHRAYSKRRMAAGMIEAMRALGFARFAVMGHDRGGRVAYRMALDRPDVVQHLVVVDILTTLDHWRVIASPASHRLHHWALLAQPAPIPESLIGSDPAGWIEARLKARRARRHARGIRPARARGLPRRAFTTRASACHLRGSSRRRDGRHRRRPCRPRCRPSHRLSDARRPRVARQPRRRPRSARALAALVPRLCRGHGPQRPFRAGGVPGRPARRRAAVPDGKPAMTHATLGRLIAPILLCGFVSGVDGCCAGR